MILYWKRMASYLRTDILMRKRNSALRLQYRLLPKFPVCLPVLEISNLPTPKTIA